MFTVRNAAVVSNVTRLSPAISRVACLGGWPRKFHIWFRKASLLPSTVTGPESDTGSQNPFDMSIPPTSFRRFRLIVSTRIVPQSVTAAARVLVRSWWRVMAPPAYRRGRSLLITADAGGSNGARLRLWKWELHLLANRTLTLARSRPRWIFAPAAAKTDACWNCSSCSLARYRWCSAAIGGNWCWRTWSSDSS